MSSYWNCISYAQDDQYIYNANGKRVVDPFIKGILDAGRTEANEPHRVIISRANIEINEQILPLMMCL
jgi:vacuolar-type H+-ATPase subunit E/Vma4